MKWLLCLCSLFLFACSSQPTRYGFTPVVEGQEKVSSDEHGAAFPVKVDGQSGEMRLMSYGVVDLVSGKKERNQKAVENPALHLCMIVTNKSSTNWKLDLQKQKVNLADGSSSVPAFVNSNMKEYPVATVPAGKTRHVDLFYPLPKSKAAPKDIPGFDFYWQIASGKNVTKEKTVFVQVHRPLEHGAVTVNMPLQHQDEVYDMEDMSPNIWWYDPMYPGMGFPEAPVY